MELGYIHKVDSLSMGNPSFGRVSVSGEHQPDITGSTFFVDYGTGSDYNTGKSWSKPFKTIQMAIDTSNVNISKPVNSSKRNTIFLTGTFTPTNLTVFPSRCDVIGVGTSNNSPKAMIYGYHNPNVAGTVGTRFFNIWWQCATYPTLRTLVTLNSTISGCEFHNCMFDGEVYSITNTASPYMTVKNCQFRGTAGSSININSGVLQSVYIEDSIFNPDGIYVNTNLVSADKGGYFRRNLIISPSHCIVDFSNVFYVVDNRCFSKLANGTNHDEVIKCNIRLAQNNRVTALDTFNAIFPAEGTF